MKIINNFLLYAILLFLSITIFQMKELVGNQNKQIEQVSTDIQDLTHIIQQSKIMECMEEGNKISKSLKDWD